MTKIPSVAERVEIICACRKGSMDDKQFKATVEYNLTADRTALLTELRDGGWLNEKPVSICGFNFKEATVNTESAVKIIYAFEKRGHNTLAKAIKAYINNLIK